MAIFRLGKGGADCELIAGNVDKHEDWRDGRGRDARFSRPHQMAAFRANELLLTDIDNRAVPPGADAASARVEASPTQ